MAIDHDNLYKELITNFFKEFMEGFFPEVSEYIDYSHLDFLEQETYDIKKDEPDNFNLDFPFFDVLNFSFMQLHLKKLDWKEYLRRKNPVVAALMSKMDYSEEEKKQELSEELLPEEVSKLEKLVTSWEKRGREEGREEGKKERDKEIAKQMLEKGYKIEEIIDITDLNKEEIENIKKEG